MVFAEKKRSFEDLINSEPLLLVDFTAEWCGPCQMMKPVLEELKSGIGNTARIIKIDVDKNKRVAMQYNIQGVPTFILFKKGTTVWRQSGAVPLHQLKQLIERNR